MKVYFYTLGCKVNQYETEVMREEFEKYGIMMADEKEKFDIAVINSCSVTAESDRKTRQALHRIRRQNPEAVIVLTGCMVQAFPKEAESFLDADIIIGNTDVKKTVEKTIEFLKEKKRFFEVCPHLRNESFNTPILSSFAERTRAYMKIEDGCERYCTYCIIPYARGFVRSKPLDEIKKEAKALAENGFSEIVLVGINLTSYGKDEDINLCDAVEAVCEIEGIKRVRLGSLEPDHISDDMLLRFKAEDKFCPQFHLSLQSGCDKTLKAMNRKYDTAFYRDLVLRIRKIFPDSAITTDIMVGFAGETEKDFNESLAFAKEIGFAKAHIFCYSRREGTIAFNMPNQVTKAEKHRRSIELSEACKKTEEKFLSSLIGQQQEVLFETEEKGFFEGFTKNYSRVRVMSTKDLSGKCLNCLIKELDGEILIGELI